MSQKTVDKIMKFIKDNEISIAVPGVFGYGLMEVEPKVFAEALTEALRGNHAS